MLPGMLWAAVGRESQCGVTTCSQSPAQQLYWKRSTQRCCSASSDLQVMVYPRSVSSRGKSGRDLAIHLVFIILFIVCFSVLP